jgi:hypothetical protein
VLREEVLVEGAIVVELVAARRIAGVERHALVTRAILGDVLVAMRQKSPAKVTPIVRVISGDARRAGTHSVASSFSASSAFARVGEFAARMLVDRHP